MQAPSRRIALSRPIVHIMERDVRVVFESGWLPEPQRLIQEHLHEMNPQLVSVGGVSRCLSLTLDTDEAFEAAQQALQHVRRVLTDFVLDDIYVDEVISHHSVFDSGVRAP
jgi:hypothetical protein